jgi:signal transduction protein with GAF and PtsI domain
MTLEFQHQSLAEGRWFAFSLAEQLGNIGSEVSRALRARGDEKRFEGAVARALELFDLTLSDPRWRKRLKEIARARELFCDAALGGAVYGTALEDLDKYFYYFAFAARSNR